MKQENVAVRIRERVASMSDEDIRAIGWAIIRDLNKTSQAEGVKVSDVAAALGLPGCRQVVIDNSSKGLGTLTIFTTAVPNIKVMVIYVKEGRNLSDEAEKANIKEIYWEEVDRHLGGKHD
jgi:hypothetical protein